METSHTQKQNKHKGEKVNVETMKENDVWKEKHITVTQEPKTGKQSKQKGKNKTIINSYPNEQHHRIKRDRGQNYSVWKLVLPERTRTEIKNLDGKLNWKHEQKCKDRCKDRWKMLEYIGTRRKKQHNLKRKRYKTRK